MHIDLRKMLKILLAAALAMTMGISYADNDDDDDDQYRWGGPFKKGQQKIVISLAIDPYEDPEPACVALQIGANLLMNDLNGDKEGGKVRPADEVTLFATLDGVELVANDLKGLLCRTPLTPPDSDPDTPLAGVLYNFVENLGGQVVVCPLCWIERDYHVVEELPTYGSVGNAFDIHELFMEAGKVLSF